MTHRQRNVIGGPGKLRLADPDRPIAVLVELRENLPNPERLRTGNDPQLPVRRPTSLTRPEKLIRNRAPHQRGNQPYVPRLHSSPARNGWGSEKDHTPRGLLRVTLEKAIDHEAAQAVSNEVQPAGLQVPYEPLQPRSDLGHGGCRG